MKKFKKRKNCRICFSKKLFRCLNFGTMPLAGGFLKKKDLPNEKLYPLSVVFCKSCSAVQILENISSNILFKDYRFISSTTKTLSQHFIKYAKSVKKKFLKKNSFVVEFGSNDGVLLKPFKDLGVHAVGVEPATNIAKIAKRKGLTVINDFFNLRVAKKIRKKFNYADLICANNVFAHMDNIHEPMRGIKFLLKKDGVFVFEVHYLVNLLKQYQFDMIYHEHFMYHSLMALKTLFKKYKMNIFDVKKVYTHSGSIRVFAQNLPGKRKQSANIRKMIKEEKKMGIDKINIYKNFDTQINDKKTKLIKILKKLKKQKKIIAGYGASGRASMMINFYKIENFIDYVFDESRERIGRMIPGTKIPIINSQNINKKKPDYAVMFAYNYKKEILDKEKQFVKSGGRFIIPLPEPKIVN